MARVSYERRNDSKLGDDNALNACTAEYRLCYNSQRPSAVQRRPPRHLLEAWYFWLGIALPVVSVIFSVFYPMDVTRVSVVTGETIGNSISQDPIKIRYL